MSNVKEFLAKACASGPLSQNWIKLQEFYEKRLWHELTEELLTFVKNEYFKINGGLLELYRDFLSDFEHRINSLSYAEIMLVIGQEIKDYEEAIKFFEKTQEKVKGNIEGKILCRTAIGRLHLQQQKLDDTKKIIKETESLLDSLDGVSKVHGRFYELSSNYSKVIGSYNDYYRDALRLLGCMDLTQMSDSELQERAFNLSLAALLGNEIYNFGELLSHKVLEYLKGSSHSWLIDVLYAFNSGNINKFLELKSNWSTQPDLAANESSLMEKIILLCLMEVAFNQKSTDRSFSFEHIAKETRLAVGEVELLVMKALSLGLVKGSIDEVNQMVHITWVQPRVLDTNQITNMRSLLGNWTEKVKSSVFLIEDHAPELLVN